MKKGDKYGLLTAVEPVSVEVNGKLIKTDVWKFECDCKNEYVCRANAVHSGNTRSCGCLLLTNSLPSAMAAQHFIEGTHLEKIASNNIYKNNTSGVKGVFKKIKKHKYKDRVYQYELWCASIMFKGVEKRKTFKHFDDAVKWRQEMEDKIFKPFIEEHMMTN